MCAAVQRCVSASCRPERAAPDVLGITCTTGTLTAANYAVVTLLPGPLTATITGTRGGFTYAGNKVSEPVRLSDNR